MINIIVATDEDLLIGKKDSRNGMPWNVPESPPVPARGERQRL